MRDALLGREPKDYDVATDAKPAAVRELFGHHRTLAFGSSFGVIGVLPPGDQRDRSAPIEPTEVATFRSDGDYSDGRRPDSVHYGNEREDALRRDFTINGLFYDPQQHAVIDYVGGQRDLDQRVLRTIGDPLDRFNEDKLRMLRAVRLATTLEFVIEPATREAIRQHASDIAVVSSERIGAEMRRLLTSPSAARGLQRLIECGLDQQVLPEVAAANLERYRTLIDHASPCDLPLALACLISVIHDPGDALGKIAQRWRLSNEETRKAAAALNHWTTVAHADQLPWHVVQGVLINRDVETIVSLASALVVTDQLDRQGLAKAESALRLPEQQLNPPPLITGNDLSQLGIAAGPQFRSILQAIREAQLDGAITTQAEAFRMVQEIREA